MTLSETYRLHQRRKKAVNVTFQSTAQKVLLHFNVIALVSALYCYEYYRLLLSEVCGSQLISSSCVRHLVNSWKLPKISLS
jgi:hypothetical protein